MMSAPQTLLALRFVDLDAVAALLAAKVAGGSLEGVSLAPDAEPTGDELKGATFATKDFTFAIDGKTYPARLANLPAVVETHKTFDRATYYKCGDVGQVVLVFKDAAARRADLDRCAEFAGSAWAGYHRDGLTPPMHDCVGRRFAKARKRARTSFSPEEIASVEKEMADIGRREGRIAEEPPHEDVVKFEPWMVDGRGEGLTFSEDHPRASQHPWILLGSQDLDFAPRAPAGPATPNGRRTSRSSSPRGAHPPGDVASARARVAAELKAVSQAMKDLAADDVSPNTAVQKRARAQLAKLREKKGRLMAQITKLDQELMEAALGDGPPPAAGAT